MSSLNGRNCLMLLFTFMFSTGQSPITLCWWRDQALVPDCNILSYLTIVNFSVLSQIRWKWQYGKSIRPVQNVINFHFFLFYVKFLGLSFLLFLLSDQGIN